MNTSSVSAGSVPAVFPSTSTPSTSTLKVCCAALAGISLLTTGAVGAPMNTTAVQGAGGNSLTTPPHDSSHNGTHLPGMYPTSGPPNVTQAIVTTAENLQKGMKIVEEMKLRRSSHVLKKRDAPPKERTQSGDLSVSFQTTGERLRKFCSTGKPHNKIPMVIACKAVETGESSATVPRELLDFCESSKKDNTPVEKEFCSLVLLKKNDHWGAVASLCCFVVFGIALIVLYCLLRVRGDSGSQHVVTCTRGSSTP